MANDEKLVEEVVGESSAGGEAEKADDAVAGEEALDDAQSGSENETGADGGEMVSPEDGEGDKQIDFDALLKKKRFSLFLKRCFDITASALGLLFLAIPFGVIAIIIKATSKGPVYFRQVRVGKDGKEFRIFKFRTMVVDAEKKGMQITVGADNRITGIGKFLRKTKVDELPQLINVLIGDMSFVGPRPEVPRYVAMYSDYQRNILKIKPGITELASIVYRDENDVLAKSEDPEATYVNEIMPKKIELNIQYMQKLGFWYDIKLIFMTFAAILR